MVRALWVPPQPQPGSSGEKCIVEHCDVPAAPRQCVCAKHKAISARVKRTAKLCGFHPERVTALFSSYVHRSRLLLAVEAAEAVFDDIAIRDRIEIHLDLFEQDMARHGVVLYGGRQLSHNVD